MGCGVGCARILLIVFNFIFWLSGAALVAIGVWLIVDKKAATYLPLIKVLQNDQDILRYGAYVLIVVGAIVLIVGFLGCCGALRRNRCMLTTYIVFLVIVMLLEIAAGVLGIVFREKITSGLESEWNKRVKKIYDNNESDRAFRQAVDAFQTQLACCGYSGPADYNGLSCLTPKTGNCTSGIGYTYNGVPYSCCPKSKCTQIGTSNMYTNGCKKELTDWLKGKIPLLIGIGIGIACIELFGLIFAVCLCRNVDED